MLCNLEDILTCNWLPVIYSVKNISIVSQTVDVRLMVGPGLPVKSGITSRKGASV